MNDQILMNCIGQYIQHHRLLQNKSQSEVAGAAGISRSTLSLLENGENTNLLTLIRVLRILQLLHIMDSFQFENRPSPIELAKLDQKQRKRARRKQS